MMLPGTDHFDLRTAKKGQLERTEKGVGRVVCPSGLIARVDFAAVFQRGH
jgi:hypothetical protein